MRASIVVITKNQRSFLARSLPMLGAQVGVGGDHETIVVDSGSTDGAQRLVSSFGARLIPVAPRDFGYARAHNLGAAAARGEFVVRLSGDAVPAHTDWLRRLLAPFDDPEIAATWGSQILPRGVKNLLERFGHQFTRNGFRTGPRSYGAGIDHLPPAILGCNMAVRRDLWARFPYDEKLPQAEDYAWLLHWLRRGKGAVFVPHAPVHHGHDEPLGRALRRAGAQTRLVNRLRRDFFGR